MRFDESTGKIVSALDRIRDTIDRNSETLHSLIKISMRILQITIKIPDDIAVNFQ